MVLENSLIFFWFSSFLFIFGGFSVTQVERYHTMLDLQNLTQFVGFMSVHPNKNLTPSSIYCKCFETKCGS